MMVFRTGSFVLALSLLLVGATHRVTFADGSLPSGTLIAVNGVLYGTTQYDTGSRCDGYGCGVIFGITPSGNERILHYFGGPPNDGNSPNEGLINVGSELFGLTMYGGALPCSCGTVFKVNAISGAYDVLYSFKGPPSDGLQPVARLFYLNGVMYGTTTGGGAGQSVDCQFNCGTVFSVTPSGTEHVIHNFTYQEGARDGAWPESTLVDLGGLLYGTTNRGGTGGPINYAGFGTVFSVSPQGAEKVVHSFSGLNGGGVGPTAALLNVNGTLYGTTTVGGANNDGTVFSITPAGVVNVIYSFGANANDGQQPSGTLIDVRGILYGTTYAGGVGGNGTVFSVTLPTPTGKRARSGVTETVLHSFGGPPNDGLYPEAGLVYLNGLLYGVTYNGGKYYKGTLFSITPAGVEKIVHNFGHT